MLWRKEKICLCKKTFLRQSREEVSVGAFTTFKNIFSFLFYCTNQLTPCNMDHISFITNIGICRTVFILFNIIKQECFTVCGLIV